MIRRVICLINPLSFTNDGYDTGTDVTTDAHGNIYVTGTVRGTSIDWLDPNKDILTTKYDPSGEKLWEARYNGNSNGADEGVAVVDVEGNVYVLGRSINVKHPLITQML